MGLATSTPLIVEGVPDAGGAPEMLGGLPQIHKWPLAWKSQYAVCLLNHTHAEEE